MNLNSLRDKCYQIAVEKGFTEATFGEGLMLIVTELAEALEDLREGNKPNEYWYEVPKGYGNSGKRVETSTIKVQDQDETREVLTKPCGIPSEMADVLIRVLHFCGQHNIDIEKAVKEKMLFNETRPYKHGKKF